MKSYPPVLRFRLAGWTGGLFRAIRSSVAHKPPPPVGDKPGRRHCSVTAMLTLKVGSVCIGLKQFLVGRPGPSPPWPRRWLTSNPRGGGARHPDASACALNGAGNQSLIVVKRAALCSSVVNELTLVTLRKRMLGRHAVNVFCWVRTVLHYGPSNEENPQLLALVYQALQKSQNHVT